MKQRFLTLLAAVMVAVSGFSAIPYSLNESFESGIPSTWSQEVVNTSAGGAWVIDTLNTNPNNAYEGSYRVVLRNLNGSYGYCVRLVTPAMDLSSIVAPMLSFAYAQKARQNYSDTLSVYYRVSEEADWILVRKYENSQSAWSLQELELPAACRTATCQLAFEGKQAGGYGVVLDRVRVYPQSQCLDAAFTGIAIGSNAAMINWTPRANQNFELVVSPTAIPDLSNINDTTVAYHSASIVGVGQTVFGLTPSTLYYVYVRTDCSDNESGYTNWIDTTFTTAVGIPYAPNLSAIPSTWVQKQGAAAASVAGTDLADNTSSYLWKSTSNTTVLGVEHLYAQSNGTPSWALTPSIDITNLQNPNNGVLLSFRLALTASATATTACGAAAKATSKFHVYISSDEGDTWALLRTIEGSEMSNTGLTYNMMLDDYMEAGALRVAFVADAQAANSTYFHLSDLSIAESDGTCLGISGLKPTVTSTSITLNWSKIGRSAAIVTLADDAAFSNVLAQQTVTGTTHTFSGLTQSQTYYVKVREDCEAGDSLVAQLKTPCPPTTITKEVPFEEGFEGYEGKAFDATDGVSPDCWQTYSDDAHLPHVIDSVSSKIKNRKWYRHTGMKALTFYGNGSNYAVLPEFTNALNTLRVNFWMQCDETSTTGSLTLGYITDGDINLNTFQAIASYTGISGQMTERLVSLETLPDEAKTLVFRWTYAGKASTCCIDDIKISLLPQCRKVSGVSAKAVDDDMEISFTDNGAPAYDVMVTSKRVKPDTVQTTRFIVFRDTITADSVLVSGLAPTTTYYAYVHPVCEEQEEDVDWSDNYSFMTPCGAVLVTRDEPWTDNFESYSEGNFDGMCWKNRHTSGSSTSVFKISTSSNGNNSTHQLQLPDMQVGNITLLTTPQFDIDEANAYTFALDVYRSHSSYNDSPAEGIRLFASLSDTVDASAVELAYIPREYAASGTNVGAETTSGWYTYEFVIPVAGSKVSILVQGESQYGTSTYMDNFIVSKMPTCHNMGAVSLQSATANSATLRFDATNAPQYQVVVATKSINPVKANLSSDTIVYNQLVSTTTPLVSGLNGNSRYYVYVRGFCGGDDYSTWSEEFVFKTLCTAISVEDFGLETFDDEGSADCWTFGFTTPGSSKNNAYAKRDRTQSYGAYIKLSKESVGTKNAANVDTVYSDGAYAISPELDVEDIRAYQVSFDAATISQAATNYKRLNVGILVDPNDMSGNVIIKTIDLDYAADSTELKTYAVSFANYEGDYLGEYGRFIIFQLNEPVLHDSTNFVLIDNVQFEPVATCEQVIETAVDSVSGTWAAISWENTQALEYEVMLAQINSRRPDTISAPLFADTLAATHATFTDLTGNTVYYAYVRAICGAGDTAKWSNALRIRTTQTPVVPPYTDDFEEDNKWLFVNGNTNAWVWGTAAHNGGTHALYVSDDDGATNNYNNSSADASFATKYFRFEETASYTFQYDWQANGEGSYDYLRVVLAPSTADLSAGALPNGLTNQAVPKGWIALDGGSKLNGVTAWQHMEQAIKVPAGLYKVVLVWRNDNSYGTQPPAAIDNFSIEIIACPKPTGLAASLTPGDGSVATLHWDGEVTASEWVLQYATDTLFANAMDTTVTDTLINLSGLTPETTYYARIKALCGETAESGWGKFISFTPTDAYTLLLNDGTATSGNVPIYGLYAEVINRSQFVIPAADLAPMQWGIISQLTFYAQQNNVDWGNAQFEVYMAEVSADTISALTDWGSMELVKTAGSLSIVNNKMVVTLNAPYQYQGGNLLIGFKQTVAGTYSTSTWYGVTATGASMSGKGSDADAQRNFLPKMLIDFAPGEQPACVKAKGITVENITTDSATVVVPDMDVNGYHFIVAKSTITVDNLTPADSAQIIFNDSIMGDTILQLTELAAATPYYIYARAICDEGHGAWSAPVSFTTACGVITVSDGNPFYENFNSLTSGVPECWTNGLGNASDPWERYSSGHDGACVIFDSYYNTYGAVDTLVTPSLELADDATLSFWWKNPEGGAGAVLISADGGATKTVLESNLTNISTWRQFEKDLTAYTGQIVQIYFVGTSNYSDDYDAILFLDDVKVRVIPSCLPVTGVIADSIATDSVRIRFDRTDAATYNVAVTSAQLDMYHLTPADSAKIVFSANNIADTVLFANGLQPASTYYIYVRTLCDGGTVSEWTEPVAFTTACGIITVTADMPWSVDFENYTTGTFADPCWINEHRSGNGSSLFTITSTAVGSNSTKKLQLPDMSSGTQTLLSLPTFALDDAYEYQFSLDVYRKSYSTIKPGEGVHIYASLNSTFDNTAVKLAFIPREYSIGNDTVPAVEEAGWYTYTFAIPMTGDVRLFILGTSEYGSSTTMDNFVLDKVPDCKKVQGLGFRLTQGDGSVASLYWTPDTVSSWKVQYATTEDFAAAAEITVSDTAYVALSGLVPETTYYARVKALCSEDSEGAWSDVISFTPTDALTLTVNEGTATNSNLPVYGLYVDHLTEGQFIIPAADLEMLQWDSIMQLTFYSSTTSASWGAARFEVYMAEVPSTTISAYVDWSALTKVKNVGSLSISGGKMVVTLDNPYHYSDGNLLIGFKQTVIGTYTSCSWQGVTANGASVSGYDGSVTQRNFLPKMTIDYAIGEEPACIRPSALNVSKIGATAATITFKPSAAPDYDLVITTEAIDPDTLAQVADSILFSRDTVTTDTIALTGLASSTDYYVYLRGLCTDTTISDWVARQFTTRCLEAVPYSENFDDTNNRKPVYQGTTTYFIPACWEEGYDSQSYISRIDYNSTSGSTYSYSGNAALRLYSGSTSKSYVILPEMDASLDTMQITFKARAMYQGSSSVSNYATSTYAHSVKIGTLVDPTDFSTFRLIETYTLTEVATTPSSADAYWEDVTVYLQGATGKYIALVSDFNKTNYVWIDDLEISRAPDCIAPSAITASAGTTTVDITWSSIATQFEVALGHAGFALPAGADSIYTVNDTLALHIADLEPSTNYELYIRAICGGTVESDWSRVTAFATGCPVPYSDDFEQENRWTLINGTQTNAWAWGSAANNGASNALYISSDGGSSYSYNISSSAIVFATKTFAFEEEGGYIFQYDWMANGESTYDYLRVALAPAGTTLTAGSTPSGLSASSLPTGWLALDGGSKLNGVSDWQTIQSDEISLRAGQYMVVFAWKNDGLTGTQGPAAIDNFNITKVLCSAPLAPTVTDVTDSSAIVRWDTIAPAYELALIRGNDTIRYTIAGNDTLLLNNLNSSTSYIVRMRAFCEDEEVSGWSAPAGFTTACATIALGNTGWSENFDGITSGIPGCWDNSEGTTTSASYKWSYNSNGYDGACVRFDSYSNSTGNTNFLATPEIMLTADAELTFQWKNPTGGAGEVLISTDGGATKTRLENDMTGVADWRKYEIDLSDYTGQTVIIYFKGTSNYGSGQAYLSLDDVSIMPYSGCRAVKDVTVSQISQQGARVNFHFADGLVHDAHVAISREAAFDPTTALIVDTIADTTYMFNVALQDKVTYYIYVRQACDDTLTSAWKQVSFVTPYVIRYEADLSATGDWANYKGLMDQVLAGTASLTPYSASGYSGWVTAAADTILNAPHVKGDIYGDSWNYWFVSPLVSLAAPDGSNVQLRFDAGLTPYSASGAANRNTGTDDRFAVLVSTNNGKSWTKLAEWNNSGSALVYNDIPEHAATFNVDLGAYVGQSVRVAFYGESTASNADNWFHLGNIVINRSILTAYEGVVCDGNEYVGEDYGNSFLILPEQYELGENFYSKYIPAVNGSGLPDSVMTLTLEVMGIETFEDSVVLCEGEHFNDIIHGGEFDFDATLDLQDQVRFVQSEFGCDNIVKLKITVNPKVTAHVYDSVAQGDEYIWHGHGYISATTAQFDTVSLITGCDSTVYLHLSVYQKEDTTHHGIEGVYAQSLIIAPNPVKVGEPIRILNAFVAEQLADARIEIISTTGALVYVQHGAEAPLSLPGIPVSGVYTVRIIVGKEIYISSLLVH